MGLSMSHSFACQGTRATTETRIRLAEQGGPRGAVPPLTSKHCRRQHILRSQMLSVSSERERATTD